MEFVLFMNSLLIGAWCLFGAIFLIKALPSLIEEVVKYFGLRDPELLRTTVTYLIHLLLAVFTIALFGFFIFILGPVFMFIAFRCRKKEK